MPILSPLGIRKITHPWQRPRQQQQQQQQPPTQNGQQQQQQNPTLNNNNRSSGARNDTFMSPQRRPGAQVGFRGFRKPLESVANKVSSREESKPNRISYDDNSKESFNVFKVHEEAAEDSIATTVESDTRRLATQCAELQEELLVYDSETSKDVLLTAIEKSEQDNNAKSETLAKLQTKLRTIMIGLDEIEEERNDLSDKAKILEEEKAEIKHTLKLREKELQAIAKRVSAQADKVKEATIVKSERDKLSMQVQDLEQELMQTKASQSLLQCHEEELVACARERDELKAKLVDITAQHDSVTRKLEKSLKDLENMLDDKREWEEERRRLLTKADLDLQQQRLDLEKTSRDLRDDLLDRDAIIRRLENRIRESLTTVDNLQQERDEFKHINSGMVETLENDYEKRVQRLRKEHKTEVESLQSQHDEKASHLRKKLQEKIGVITKLEGEYGACMQELMGLTGEIDRLKLDSRLVDDLTADLEALQQEKSSMEEWMHEKDTEIAELSAELLKVELEKEFALDSLAEFEKLQSKSDIDTQQRQQNDKLILEQELKSAQVQVKTLEDDLKAVLRQRSEDSAKVDDERTIAMNEMKDELFKFEDEAKRYKLLYEEECAARFASESGLKNEMQQLRTELACQRNSHAKEVQDLGRQIRTTKTQLLLRSDEIRDLKVIEIPELKEQLEKLRSDNNILRSTVADKEQQRNAVIDSYETQLKISQNRVAELELKVTDQSRLHQQLSKELSESLAELQRDKEWQEVVINDQKRSIEDLQVNINSLETMLNAAQEAERELQELKMAGRSNKVDGITVLAQLEAEEARSRKLSTELQAIQRKLLGMESDLRSYERKDIAKDEHVASLEQSLHETNTRIKQLSEQSSEYDAKLKRETARIGQMQSELFECQEKLFDAVEEAKLAKDKLRKTEDKLLDELYGEQNKSELLEADLLEARHKLEAIKRENKDTTELKKEVEALQDKIRRQDAYIRRKLEKEKVTRVKKISKSSIVPPNERKSRIRANNNTSAVMSRATMSTTSADTSIDWDLDELLAD